MFHKGALALWITGLLVVAQHYAAYSAHQQPPEHFSSLVGLRAVTNTPDVTAYHHTSNYSVTLPLPLLRNGIVYTGDNVRLRRVVEKLLRGERTSVGVIGGSVSYGYGVRRNSSDWFSIFASYLRRAFPLASITARNGCVPGAKSEYISMCLEKFVYRNVDLIFAEFATSDGYLDTSANNPYVHAFERLIRKLLKLPNHPAVVLLNHLHKNAIKSNSLFHHTIEDHYGVLAQYYQLPWLSVRDAVWLGFRNNWEGFRFQDMFLSAAMHPWLPNELGHKYIADVAVTLIQQTLLELMLLPLSTADMAYRDDIPSPMFPHNYESQNAGCAIGLDLKAAALSVHKDWQFVNDGSLSKPRWGFVCRVPNATLVLTVGTREMSARHIPHLTLQRKAEILHHHGIIAAAAQLQDAQPGMAAIGAGTVTASAAVAQAGSMANSANPTVAASVTETSDGLQAAIQESLRQAAVAERLMQSGHLSALVGLERVVGGQRSGFQLPADAREVAGSATSTGVEVVVNSGGKLLIADAANTARGGASHGDEVTDSNSNNGSSSHLPGAPSSNSNRDRPLSSGDRGDNSSKDDTGTSGSRAVLGMANPNAVPPPLDALHVKPGGSSIRSAFGGKRSSFAHTDMIVWIGYHTSHRMMGKAKLSCISGCVCRDAIVDACRPEKTNRLAMAKLLVTQHERCQIGVQVLEDTSSGHTRFKVTGVMVSKAVEYRSAESHAESALMGALEEAGHYSTGA